LTAPILTVSPLASTTCTRHLQNSPKPKIRSVVPTPLQSKPQSKPVCRKKAVIQKEIPYDNSIIR
jgi:hypothetical protein